MGGEKRGECGRKKAKHVQRPRSRREVERRLLEEERSMTGQEGRAKALGWKALQEPSGCPDVRGPSLRSVM